jgi:uncharacterized protein (TIGR02266 family)
MEERRESPRLPISARVVFKEGKREEVYFSEDLSLGGLYLKTENPPGIGTSFELEIAIPGLELIKAKGEVIWKHTGNGFGIRFTRMTAQNKKILKSYLEKVTSK